MTAQQSPDAGNHEPRSCLVIDTALEACSVALAISDETGAPANIFSRSQIMSRGHAEVLMSELSALLAEAKCDYADITHIAVTIGPGSFTGLRVGLATARALALALDCPIKGLSSLKALELTARAQGSKGPVLSAIDARRGQIYAQFFNACLDSEPKALSAAELVAHSDFKAPLCLIGSGVPHVLKAVKEQGGPSSDYTVMEVRAADIKAMARWALTTPFDDKIPTPLYLRGPDAKPQVGKAIARA
ncbi:MAG: tRNA (adenosine(37)-N6)-threonylcarbamoyltransferase complex dimerization subunit type 1 TsaB [Cohaesibacter sp.]|jgi:tRNA threonylcarbamoyladenosine biosynthesis protein TsaB|nr:tRNA (adenosine(37)-N6)-threonylcarbamoyltransferase complex dimerization subunit type 1 TsaB [Cohaesibacter sp.]